MSQNVSASTATLRCYRLSFSAADPGYIAAFCRTPEFLLQKRRSIANTGTAYNSEDTIGSFLIVAPKIEEQQRIGNAFRRTLACSRIAGKLTEAARFLVEALIEGKVTESELVAAHKSADADRALLVRLTADGLDVADAEPLFSDLDRLEELLEEAQ